LAAKTLLLHGISGTLKDILSGSGLVAGTTVSPTLTRPADQVNIAFIKSILARLYSLRFKI
jgi:E3 ubiquitin-protein ligase TRIP12